MDTRRHSGTTSQSTQTTKSSRIEFEKSEQYHKTVNEIAAGNSVIILGEAGTGKGDFALALHEELSGEYQSAIATYKGSIKKFFQAIAMQLDAPTENDQGKPLTVDQLKEEILLCCDDDTLLILPEAKRLTTSIRYWLEDMLSNGARICCFAVANPGKGIFLDMLEIELELPSDRHIRDVMIAEAQKQGLQISKSRLAELQPLAGRNPGLARKVIKNEALGLKQDKPEHTQYINIMPIIIALLMSFGIIRFIGMGTGNRGLYIFGGVTLVAGMTLKQLGSVKGARKRLGQ